MEGAVEKEPNAFAQLGSGAEAVTVRPVVLPNLPSLREATGVSDRLSIVSVGLQPRVHPDTDASWFLILVSHVANWVELTVLLMQVWN